MSTSQFVLMLAGFILLATGISAEIGVQLGRSLGELVGEVLARRREKR